MAKVVVVAPHPDDEVLGVGGTIARLSREHHEIIVALVTPGDSSMFDPAFVEQGRREALRAHELLGVSDTIFLRGFPAALLDMAPQAKVNEALGRLLEEIKPEMLFIPFNGDLHRDHRVVFESALVAARPRGAESVRNIYAYETLSETNWYAPPLTPGFFPNTYFDISAFLEIKLEAMRTYRSQLKSFPHERSLEAMRALGRLRGATVGFEAAEAFILIRAVCPLEGHESRTG